MVILENRDPVKTISWGLFIILIPVIGIIGYLIFGQNYRKEKIFSRKELVDLERISSLSRDQVNELPHQKFLKNKKINEKRNIMTLLLNNSKALLTQYNKVNILINGEETFDSIINALNIAKDHIHMEFYRWESDNIGNRIKDVLVKKAREGVKIRIIYDDVGSWKISKMYLKELKKEGIKTYAFMPVRFPYLTSKANFRNHRKIIVVDGKIGFVGGFNIADKYIHGDPKVGFWRDSHLRLEGESVHSLQMIFLVDWYFISRIIIGHQLRYFPNHKVNEECLIQITSSGPDSDWSSIMQAYFAAISTAKENIFISTPYFSPNPSILTALKTASLSGVDVRIILPARSDSTIAYWNSISYIGEMLDAGIRVYLYEKGFNHTKIIMVDGVFSSIGSANVDYRSFDLNFEVNALIYNEIHTISLENDFRRDLENSHLILPGEWKKRPLKQKVSASLARILGPLY
jgi:cardiolipin synthase